MPGDGATLRQPLNMRNSVAPGSVLRHRHDPYTPVFGRIDNLLNERYQNPTGFDRPGFGIFGGIRVANR